MCRNPFNIAPSAALKSKVEDNTQLIDRRIDLIMDSFRRLSIPCMKPDGSFYVFPKIAARSENQDLSLVEKLLQSGVAVAPGSGFGSLYHNFIRLSACQPETLLSEGLEKFERIWSSR